MKYLSLSLIFLLLAACKGPSPSKPEAQPAIEAKPADENAVIRILEATNKAQDEYIKRNRRYALTYEELIESHLMQQEPSSSDTGYEIRLRPAADAGSYRLVATPLNPSASSRYFFTDKTGVIRAEQGKDATAESPQIAK